MYSAYSFSSNIGIFIMAMIRLATSPKKSNDGYVKALATVIETIELVTVQKDGFIEKVEKDCFKVLLKTETIDKKDMTMNIAIFGTFNPNSESTKRIGSKNVPIYNKLTTVLLKLNVIDKEFLDKAKSDIDNTDLADMTAQFLAIKDLPVRFKTLKNAKGFLEPDIMSLEVTGDMPIVESE